MFSLTARAEIDRELSQASRARAEGNEGRARVCARRAAGMAIREFHRLHGRSDMRASAVDMLSGLRDEPALSGAGRLAVERLLMRVDEEFGLPSEIDLLEDARGLIGELEAQTD